jgi:ornithine carbamoyltransferase
VCEWAQQNCRDHNASYRVIDDPDSGYEAAHVVYSRHWVSPDAYQGGLYQKKDEVEKALKLNDWIVSTERMRRTDQAIYTHCMPVDRGNEVVDEVVVHQTIRVKLRNGGCVVKYPSSDS